MRGRFRVRNFASSLRCMYVAQLRARHFGRERAAKSRNKLHNNYNMKLFSIVISAMAMLLSCTASAKPSDKIGGGDGAPATHILFINGSPNADGNTAALAKVLLEGRDYETLNLNDYRINFYGQTLPGDQFEEVLGKMKQADVVVMGSPVYWHNICASVRGFIERFYGPVSAGTFKGKKFFFLYQGGAPTRMMIENGEYTMKRFAGMYGFSYEGMANDAAEAKALCSKLD